ncbi:MAG TPA: bifunctional serine/threonine-protein kinase/formylglycine-generating enzyme family protein [Planctomycetota bacterium]|nr:bifunctional serine/threonine-protein kinase/formylglycine-generating enzyme family protein [Planctomycetota bacterium]
MSKPFDPIARGDSPPPLVGAQPLALPQLNPTEASSPLAPAGAVAVRGNDLSSTVKLATRGPKSLAIGTLGQSVELSTPWQDLLRDEFIANAPRIELDGRSVPALGGIPLFSKIGQGGMGAVYYGIHRGLASEVAVKVLPFHLAQIKPELVKRFFREARIASKINSEHLVRVTDVAQEGKLSFLVMEFVDGKSAWSMLRDIRLSGQRAFDELSALDICIAACKGLSAAHEANVIHRDIKPDNILVPRNRVTGKFDCERAKLADLGLARVDEGVHSMTNSEACLGTPGFMAPEQIVDSRNGAKPADVFGLGASLYSLLCGEPPFFGSTPMQAMWATIEAEHSPIRARRGDISKATSDVIDICLAKNPAYRYADGAALCRALEASRLSLTNPQGVDYAEVMQPRLDAEEERRRRAEEKKLEDAEARERGITAARPIGAAWRRRLIASAAAVLLGAFVWAVYAVVSHSYTPQNARADAPADPAKLDQLEGDNDAALAAADGARKDKLDDYTKKLAGMKAGAEAAALKRKQQENSARAEFDALLNSANEACAKQDWRAANELLGKAKINSGAAFSARGSELEVLSAAMRDGEKKDAHARNYQDLLNSIRRAVDAEPLDAFGHAYRLSAAKRAQLEARIHEAQNIDANATAQLAPVLEKLSRDSVLDLGGGALIELVLVPPGEFTMGSSVWAADNDKGAAAEHRVTISDPYYIAKLPVTVAQFRRFVDGERYVSDAERGTLPIGKGALTMVNKKGTYVSAATWLHPGFEQQAGHPVVAVSWNDAQEYAKWLSKKTQLAVRLPSEAEWEYAARGPQGWQWPWGDAWDGAKCNHADKTLKSGGILPDAAPFSDDNDGYSFTSPAGSFDNASWCGAKDMAGNVWQWCQDEFSAKYYDNSPDANPNGPRIADTMDYYGTKLPLKVLRGGSFFDAPDMTRSSARFNAPAIHRGVNIGFRVVVMPGEKK